jgi:excisionase family DNA binding protein
MNWMILNIETQNTGAQNLKPTLIITLNEGESGLKKEDAGERLLYPRKEAAYQLGISVRSLDYLITSGRIKARRLGKRNLIPASELRRVARGDQTDRIRPKVNG